MFWQYYRQTKDGDVVIRVLLLSFIIIIIIIIIVVECCESRRVIPVFWRESSPTSKGSQWAKDTHCLGARL